MNIKLKSTIFKGFVEDTREVYLKYALDFFNEIGFNNRDDLVKLLNKLNGEYATNLLFALAFYQYSEKVLIKKDDIIRPVLLTCLIDGVEGEKNISADLKIFLKRLENKDKLYLLNNFEVLQGRKKGRHFRRLYHDLIRKNKIYRNFPDTDYKLVDRDFKKIDKYIEKLADHFCNIRHFVLHEAKAVVSVARIDETYGLISTFFGYQRKPKSRKDKKKSFHLYTKIEMSELRKVIKRGVLRKIKKIPPSNRF